MCLCALMCDFVTIDGVVKIVELALAGWGCYIAKEGLGTWKDQVVETPKIELAREIMESFYNIVDFIKDVRRNMRTIDIDKIQQYFSEVPLNETQCRYLEHLYEINQSADMLINFQNLKNKAKVNFGDDLENDFIQLIRIINEIKDASSELCRYYKNEHGADIQEHEQIKNYRNVLYQQENDKINQTIKCVVNDVETKLKPIYGCHIIKIVNKKDLY